jgi:hypothetical protein
MMRHGFAIACAAIMIGGPMSSASAAPQIMALLPTDGPKALVCDKGACRAEFTVMCLEVERKAPPTGVVYELMPGSTVSVALSGPSGQTRRLDASAAHASIISLRTHVSVELTIPRRMLDAEGAASVAVSVPKTAFLIPRPVPNDPDPITIAEVRGVVGQHLRIAQQFERDVAGGLAAARLLSELINVLPTEPRTTPAQERRIVDRVFVRVLATGDGPERRALEDVRRLVERCQFKPIRRDFGTAQACLEVDHDAVMSQINMVYWDRTRPPGG